MKAVFALVMLGHGLIHLLGFVKAFGFARAPMLAPVSRGVGLLWLVTAALFAVASMLLVTGTRPWWAAALPALLLSQVLIVGAWQDAKIGTVANTLILIGVIFSLLEYRPSSYRSIYAREVGQRLALAPTTDPVLTPADVRHLPEPVRRYVDLSGAIGKPRVESVRATLRGEIKRSPESPWLPFRSEQHNFASEPARFFLMDASLYGIPFTALHVYSAGAATMQVKVATLVGIVDARGREMNQSETVTVLNDMCVLAPALLIDPRIAWKSIDARSVKATFTNAGSTVSAVLSFNDQGELVNFVSHDRFLSADGKSYRRLPWSTPLHDYRDFGGKRLASRAEASWAMPEGELVYGRFEITSVEYNVAPEGR